MNNRQAKTIARLVGAPLSYIEDELYSDDALTDMEYRALIEGLIPSAVPEDMTWDERIKLVNKVCAFCPDKFTTRTQYLGHLHNGLCPYNEQRKKETARREARRRNW